MMCAGAEPDTDQLCRYRTWKKNTPFLYRTVLTSSLPWPSLSVEWFPDVRVSPQQSESFRLLLGSRTSGQASEYLKLATVTMPVHRPDLSSWSYDVDKQEFGGYSHTNAASLLVTQQIDFHGEINKARIMPQNPDLVAGMSSDSHVYVFDRTKHASKPTGEFKPDMDLAQHSCEGFGLAWSTWTEGHLLTAAEDRQVFLWDITQMQASRPMAAAASLGSQKCTVNDVEWSPFHANLFVSACDDGAVLVTDTREARQSCWTGSAPASATSVAFSVFDHFCVASGSDRGSLSLWDLRQSGSVMCRDEAHSDSVNALSWSPHHAGRLASASSDGDVLLSGSDSLEPFFRHSGHTAAVTDVSWNPHNAHTLASVAEDNRVHVWQFEDWLTVDSVALKGGG